MRSIENFDDLKDFTPFRVVFVEYLVALYAAINTFPESEKYERVIKRLVSRCSDALDGKCALDGRELILVSGDKAASLALSPSNIERIFSGVHESD